MFKKIKYNTYPKNYKTIHIRGEDWQDLQDLEEFKNVGMQEKIKQLVRFYNLHKEKK